MKYKRRNKVREKEEVEKQNSRRKIKKLMIIRKEKIKGKGRKSKRNQKMMGKASVKREKDAHKEEREKKD